MIKRLSRWLFNGKSAKGSVSNVLFDEGVNEQGEHTIGLANVEQTIAGVRQFPVSKINDMVERRHDLDYQLSLCQNIMTAGDILPFPFERAVILLRKQKRYNEELYICLYVRGYCEKAERSWDGSSAKIWKSPKLEKCIGRIPKLEGLVKGQP